MNFTKILFSVLFIFLINISCGETKKKENPEMEAIEIEEVDEAAILAAKQKKEDSIQQAKVDSIRQDSLRQVKEHGHAH